MKKIKPIEALMDNFWKPEKPKRPKVYFNSKLGLTLKEASFASYADATMSIERPAIKGRKGKIVKLACKFREIKEGFTDPVKILIRNHDKAQFREYLDRRSNSRLLRRYGGQPRLTIQQKEEKRQERLMQKLAQEEADAQELAAIIKRNQMKKPRRGKRRGSYRLPDMGLFEYFSHKQPPPQFTA